MGWGGSWESPEERDEQAGAQDAERAAVLATEQRMRMSTFERLLLDVLGDIRDSLPTISAEPESPPSGSALPDDDASLRDDLVAAAVALGDYVMHGEPRNRDRVRDLVGRLWIHAEMTEADQTEAADNQH
jgi:hypothetical protein